MTEDQRKEDTRRSDRLARLLRAAGRRPEPPPGAYEETLAIATSTWRRKVGRRRLRIRLAVAAAAAAVVGTLSLLALLPPEPADPATIAKTDRVVGPAEWRRASARGWSRLPSSQTDMLVAGTQLRTGKDGYLGLSLTDGSSLRLAPDSEIELTAEREIRLIGGRLYVDSGRPVPGLEPPLEILTPAGRAVEVGTQYEISYQRDRRYELRVREGLVRLVREGAIIESSAGEELVITPDGQVHEGTVDPASDVWHWIYTVAPVPVVDARPVTLLLDWVARETGRSLRYASPSLRESAMRTTLHGRIGTLTPLEALGVLLATTDLEYAILDDGTIEVRTRKGE